MPIYGVARNGPIAGGTAVTTAIAAGAWYDVHFEIIGTSLKGCLGACA